LSTHNRINYSTEILNVGQCIEAAKADPACTGNEVYWERRPQGSYDHFCMCCAEHTTCPPPGEDYQGGALGMATGFALLLHTYRYESCKAYSNISKPHTMCINKSGNVGIFDTPEGCMEAARNDPACDGNEVMWSPGFNRWEYCQCCSKHPTCPAAEDRYRPSGKYHVFKHKDCDDATTTDVPTDSSSSVVTTDPNTDVPTSTDATTISPVA
jgi:hypothetical protein